MAEHILENEFLRVAVADAGAELVSVYDRERRAERIWTADPAVWNRHAPILFPFVGKVADGKYRVGDREYVMKTQHGFARDKGFKFIEETEDSVTHCLEDSPETREIYPWAFRLTVRHRLEGRRLRVEWTVENRDDTRMYFSIGGHPGFLLPEGVRKEDGFLLFPGKEKLRYIQVTKDGYAVPDDAKILRTENGRTGYRDDIPGTWIFED